MNRPKKGTARRAPLWQPYVWLPLILACCPDASKVVQGEDGPDAACSLQQVLDAITAQQSAITSYYAEYRVNYLESDGMLPGAYLHRTVAMKAPASILHINAHGHAGLSSTDDPFRWTFQLHGKDWVSFRNNSRTFSSGTIEFDDLDLGSIPEEWLFWSTGMYPLTARKPFRMIGDIPYMLGDYAAEAGTKILRERQELVGERWCHVVERPGVDILWLDLGRGATLMRRDMIDGKTGKVRRRYLSGDHQEIQPGFWMPTRIRDYRFNAASRDEEPFVDFELMNWRINDVPDSLFVFTPPAGAVWVDYKTGDSYQVAENGEEHMKNVIRISRKMFDSRPASTANRGAHRNSAWMVPGIAISAVLVCVVALFLTPKFLAPGTRRREKAAG